MLIQVSQSTLSSRRQGVNPPKLYFFISAERCSCIFDLQRDERSRLRLRGHDLVMMEVQL